jgi:hypothetical protein
MTLRCVLPVIAMGQGTRSPCSIRHMFESHDRIAKYRQHNLGFRGDLKLDQVSASSLRSDKAFISKGEINENDHNALHRWLIC